MEKFNILHKKGNWQGGFKKRITLISHENNPKKNLENKFKDKFLLLKIVKEDLRVTNKLRISHMP